MLIGPTYSVDVLTHNSLADPVFLAKAIEEYNTNRTGILTNVGGDVAGKTYLRTQQIQVTLLTNCKF